ncbi:MAG: DNA-binding protein [bacterium]|nr:DNA-binding protein [bacterium]
MAGETIHSGGRVLLGKLPAGVDLREFLEGVAARHGVRLGTVLALGAVERAAFAFLDQHSRRYQTVHLNENLELLNLTGRVSWSGEEPELHAHVTLGDAEGHAFGGHLLPGTVIFAGEYWMQELLKR